MLTVYTVVPAILLFCFYFIQDRFLSDLVEVKFFRNPIAEGRRLANDTEQEPTLELSETSSFISRSLSSYEEKCRHMKENSHVIPAVSWGSLTIAEQTDWVTMDCDSYNYKKPQKIVTSISRQRNEGIALHKGNRTIDRKKATRSKILEVENRNRNSNSNSNSGSGSGSTNKKSKHVQKDMTALTKVSRESVEWCYKAKTRYKVKPQKSWGTLPESMIKPWKQLHKCDIVFLSMRMRRKPISTCLPTDTETNNAAIAVNEHRRLEHDRKRSEDSGNTGFFSNLIKTAIGHKQTVKTETLLYNNLSNNNTKLPLIAILAGSTTRKMDQPSINKLALFNILMPSLIRSLDCGFRYLYILGYDVGDQYFDKDESRQEVEDWLRKNIQEPLHANAIPFTFDLLRVENKLKKPGPVFIQMARRAYDLGADYFYRINDDTEMLANWPSSFVNTIKGLSPPYGIVGPKCQQGNSGILTHDFASRTHMEIFEMNYYPPLLVDWWMDDWISFVYGKQRTFKAMDIPVMHHTGAHGQRYKVDERNQYKLKALVEEGRKKIRSWMLKNKASEQDIKNFDKDTFSGFVHADIPNTAKPVAKDHNTEVYEN